MIMYCFNQYSKLAIFQAKLGPLREENDQCNGHAKNT